MPNGRSLIRPPFYGVPVVAAVAFAGYQVRRSARQLRDDTAASEGLAEAAA
jgi:hypothetical protein